MILSRERIIRFYGKYMIFMGSAGHLIFVLQTRKILKTKSATDVSLEGFLIALFSIASWLLYGYLKKDKVLLTVNLFGFVVGFICIVVIILLKYM